MIPMAELVERKTRHIKTPLKVAVMGCAVNGPGEAAAADVGIAGGDGRGMLIKKGEIVKRMSEAELVDTLLSEIELMTGEKIER
jgi:(E)-4-hydroxy-3-methylbut-2-enyl-diphosphate synthase